jgi:hypothetical protein
MKNHLFLFFLVTFSTIAHAGIYKWVDSNGETRYSDQPPPVQVGKQKIRHSGVPVSDLEEKQLRQDLETFKTRFSDARNLDSRIFEEQELVLQNRLCVLYNLYHDRFKESVSGLTLNASQQRRVNEQLQLYREQKNKYCGAI